MIGQTNRLWEYPAEARLLIINADDFGMCHAVNEAIFRSWQDVIVCSTTLMVLCPWSLHAMRLLTARFEIPFGIHLTVIFDWADYRWGPVAP
ncbi:MAG: ChbG/HpnK family deacetylase [Anaerolineales bacterium]|nr:ChbG/HpnK family deacetylase [Anaerolineales bacterium]